MKCRRCLLLHQLRPVCLHLTCNINLIIRHSCHYQLTCEHLLTSNYIDFSDLPIFLTVLSSSRPSLVPRPLKTNFLLSQSRRVTVMVLSCFDLDACGLGVARLVKTKFILALISVIHALLAQVLKTVHISVTFERQSTFTYSNMLFHFLNLSK
jgi:hypothetical protein